MCDLYASWKINPRFPSFPHLLSLHLEQSGKLLYRLLLCTPSLHTLSLDSTYNARSLTLTNVPSSLRELICNSEDFSKRYRIVPVEPTMPHLRGGWAVPLISQLTKLEINRLHLNDLVRVSLLPIHHARNLTHITLRDGDMLTNNLMDLLIALSPTITHIHLIDINLRHPHDGSIYELDFIHHHQSTNHNFYFPHLHSLIVTHSNLSFSQVGWPITASLYPQLQELVLHDVWPETLLDNRVSFPSGLTSLSLSIRSISISHPPLSSLKLQSIANLPHLTSLAITLTSSYPHSSATTCKYISSPSQLPCIFHSSSPLRELTLIYPFLIRGEAISLLSTLPHLHTLTFLFPCLSYTDRRDTHYQLISDLIEYFSPPLSLTTLILPSQCQNDHLKQLRTSWEQKNRTCSQLIITIASD